MYTIVLKPDTRLMSILLVLPRCFGYIFSDRIGDDYGYLRWQPRWGGSVTLIRKENAETIVQVPNNGHARTHRFWAKRAHYIERIDHFTNYIFFAK